MPRPTVPAERPPEGRHHLATRQPCKRQRRGLLETEAFWNPSNTGQVGHPVLRVRTLAVAVAVDVDVEADCNPLADLKGCRTWRLVKLRAGKR